MAKKSSIQRANSAKSDDKAASAQADANSRDLLAAVRARYLELSRSDKKVARLLFESPETFINSSVGEIAKAADVGEATVVRFGRTFGCNGFKDLKIRLAQHLAARQARLDATSEGSPGDPGNFVDQTCEYATTALREVAAHLDLDAIDRAARTIASARLVSVYGLGGSSGVLASELHNRLFRLDIPTASYIDSYMQRMSAAALRSKDVAIFVSSTGRPRSLVESAELAKYYGAGTVALTDHSSALGREVDVCLHIRLSQAGVAIEQPNPMRYAQLLVIDCLAKQVATVRGDHAQSTLERVRASIATVHGILPQQPIGD